jgi:hypothetical protein
MDDNPTVAERIQQDGLHIIMLTGLVDDGSTWAAFSDPHVTKGGALRQALSIAENSQWISEETADRIQADAR